MFYSCYLSTLLRSLGNGEIVHPQSAYSIKALVDCDINLKCHNDQNIVILLSLYLESKSSYYLQGQVSSQNSYGKSDYFNLALRIPLSAITEFKNDRDRTLRVGPRLS